MPVNPSRSPNVAGEDSVVLKFRADIVSSLVKASKQSGLLQDELANLLGTTQSKISLMLSSESSSNVSIDKLLEALFQLAPSTMVRIKPARESYFATGDSGVGDLRLRLASSVRYEVEKKGYSQREAATAMGYSVHTRVAKVLRGDLSKLSLDNLIKMLFRLNPAYELSLGVQRTP